MNAASNARQEVIDGGIFASNRHCFVYMISETLRDRMS